MTEVFKRNVFDSISKSLDTLTTPAKWLEKRRYLSATLDIDQESAQVFMIAIAIHKILLSILREKKIPRELANNVPAVLLLSRSELSNEEYNKSAFKLENLMIAQRALFYGLMKSNMSYGIMLALEEIRIWVEIYEQTKSDLQHNRDKNEINLSFTYFHREKKAFSGTAFPMMSRKLYSNGLVSKNGKSFECRFDYYSSDIKVIRQHLLFLIDTIKQPLAAKLGLINNFNRQLQTFEKAVPDYQQEMLTKVTEELRGKVFAYLESIPTGNTTLPNSIFVEAKTSLELSDTRRTTFAEEVIRFAKQDLNPRKPLFTDIDQVYQAIGKDNADILDVFLHKLEVTEKSRMIERLFVMRADAIMMLVDKMSTTLNQKGIDPKNTKVADLMEVTFSDPWRSIDALVKAIQMKGVSKAICKQIENRIFDEAEKQQIASVKYLIKMKEHYAADVDKFINAATKSSEAQQQSKSS